MKALVIEPDGIAEVRDIDASLTGLQSLVGGYIEMVPVRTSDKVHAYVNEEGKYEPLPPNRKASRLCVLHPLDWVAGTAVFLCSTPGGDEADVDEEWAKEAVRIVA